MWFVFYIPKGKKRVMYACPYGYLQRAKAFAQAKSIHQRGHKIVCVQFIEVDEGFLASDLDLI